MLNGSMFEGHTLQVVTWLSLRVSSWKEREARALPSITEPDIAKSYYKSPGASVEFKFLAELDAACPGRVDQEEPWLHKGLIQLARGHAEPFLEEAFMTNISKCCSLPAVGRTYHRTLTAHLF